MGEAIIHFLISWMPLIIVLLGFVFIMSKSTKKYYGNYTDYMVRLNELYEQNNETMKKQNEILADIAETLKERNKKG